MLRKDRNHTSISVDTEKAFDKIQYPFVIKIFSIVDIEGTYLSIIKQKTLIDLSPKKHLQMANMQ